MIREKKIIVLALLTVFLYGSIIFFEKGFFVLPFPLFDLLTLIVGIRFLSWSGKKDLLILGLFVFGLLCSMGSQAFIWSFFMDGKSLEQFQESVWRDVFYLMELLFMLATLLLSLDYKKRTHWFFAPVLIACFVCTQFQGCYLVEFFTFGLFVIFTLATKSFRPLYFIFVLKAILDLAEMSMLMQANDLMNG
jgi:hypothetical protein